MILLLSIVLSVFCNLSDALTRYACLSSPLGGALAFDSSEEGIGPAGSSMTGSLSCSNKPNTKILVTRIIHGFGNFKGCANPDQSCDKEIYSDTSVASYCDGKDSCLVHTFPQWLEKCSMMSDFVHIEYECVFDTSIFDVCREATTTVVDTSVYIVSPNVYQSEINRRSPSPWPVCECIVNSRYTDQIMADYIHSDVYASGDRCSDNYVLIESKMFPNQTIVDKEVEVCGRRTVSNQMFRGSVRLTYYNNRRSTDDGFLTKFRVPPLPSGSEIRMQCGPVRSPGEDDNRGPPPSRAPGFNSFRSNSVDVLRNQQPLWPNPYNPSLYPFTRPPFPPWAAPVTPYFQNDIPGWQNPPTARRGTQIDAWGNPVDQTPRNPNTWNNPSSNTRSNPDRGPSTSRPWTNQPLGNSPDFNDPSSQVLRDPRRFSTPAHLSPTAEQLGIVSPTKSSANTRPAGIDPRLTITNPNTDTGKMFIPWTNANKKKRASTTKRNIDQSTKPSKRRIGETTQSPSLPGSVQFLGNGQSLKMTSRQPKTTSEGVAPIPPPPPPRLVGEENKLTTKGDKLAYIIGGVGAGLIVLCCLAFFFLHTKRKRSLQALKREQRDVEQTYNESISDDPTYATPADVSFRPPLPAHDNEAYVDHEIIASATEDTQQNNDIPALSEEEEKNGEECEVFTVETQTTQTYSDSDHIDCSIYDNNFSN